MRGREAERGREGERQEGGRGSGRQAGREDRRGGGRAVDEGGNGKAEREEAKEAKEEAGRRQEEPYAYPWQAGKRHVLGERRLGSSRDDRDGKEECEGGGKEADGWGAGELSMELRVPREPVVAVRAHDVVRGRKGLGRRLTRMGAKSVNNGVGHNATWDKLPPRVRAWGGLRPVR
eukprot:766809-Hanusia_phi.AAC.1